PPPSGSDPEAPDHLARGIDPREVAHPIVVVDEPEIELGVVEAREGGQRAHVVSVRAVLRHRQLEKVDRPLEVRADGVGQLHHDGGVLRHDEMLVGGRAVTEVIPHLHALGHGIAEPRQLGHDTALVVRGAVGEEALVDEHLLAHIPLDGELGVGHGGEDIGECPAQRALVGREIGVARCRTHVHESARHRSGQANLEARADGDHHLGVQPPEDVIGIQRRRRIAGFERHLLGIDARAKAEQRHLAQELAVPLPEGEGGNGGVFLHGGVVLEHHALEEDPAAALARLAVGDPLQVRPEHGGEGAEHRFRVGQRHAPHQVRAAARPDSLGDGGRRGHAPACASGPRRSLPGSAPVCLPSRRRISPLTTVAAMPRQRWMSRRAPAGRSFTTSGISAAMVSGSKTTRSAAMPSRNTPRSEKPHMVAVSKLSMRTASSRVRACFSRTQWARRWVWSEASISCETCAPESENVTTVRGFLISSRATSWFSLAMGWRKTTSMSVSRPRSIMASTGSTPRCWAISATERCLPCPLSITWIHSYTAGRASVPMALPSSRSFAAATSFFRSSGSRRRRFCSSSGSARSSRHTGSRSKGSWVLNESTADKARLCTWAVMRPPWAAVSSSSFTYARQASGASRRLKSPK